MLESSQCGGCGTLGNGGATLPRWMSSQFGVRSIVGMGGMSPIDGDLPVWFCVDPLPARCAVGAVGWRKDPFPLITCHPVYPD